MGIYSEYLDKRFVGFEELTVERKKQLKRLTEILGGDILVYASDLKKGKQDISISYPDILPFTDQLSNMSGQRLFFILETPGGLGEIAEQIVNLIRDKYKHVSIIVPGTAKSAGTIIAMSGDEILMEPSASALGPIDAQLNWNGKWFSAEALISGFEKIKHEVEQSGQLNKAYIPMLQGVSPGDLEHARNALQFSKELVQNWLVKYKFKDWVKHRTEGKETFGKEVTGAEKITRAREIAEELCNHSRWRTHGRSISIRDLRAMGLEILDYSGNGELTDAIRRYYTLLQMMFDSTGIYKIFETPTSQIYRFIRPEIATKPTNAAAKSAIVDIKCNKCDNETKIQANFEKDIPIEKGASPFPSDNKFKCSKCGQETDMSGIRQEIEMAARKKIL